eukprot:COSAG02_NODE_26585_length_630_cov_0.589454_2_plen_35_part_00
MIIKLHECMKLMLRRGCPFKLDGGCESKLELRRR